MGEVIQFIPKPNPNRKTLDEQAAEIMSQVVAQEATIASNNAKIAHNQMILDRMMGVPANVDTSPSEMIPYHGAGIDGMKFEAPPEDCA